MWEKTFGISSIVFLVVTFFWFWEEATPDWKSYQEKFKRLALELTTIPEEMDEIKSERYGVRQIVLDRLNRVDRCMTCHVGADESKYFKLPLPFRYCKYTETHPTKKFGCSICHGGEGRGIHFSTAHGEESRTHSPILKGEYVQASCGRCHFEDYLYDAPLLLVGKRLYEHYGCRDCHKLYQKGRRAGPDLWNVASKRPDEFTWGNDRGERSFVRWMFLHFKDPKRFQNDSKMTDYRMSDENAKALTIYMLSLTDEKYPSEYHRGTKSEEQAAMR